MKRSSSRLIAGVLVLAPMLISAQQGGAGDADNGKRLYVKNGCYECHGYAAQGGAAGARLVPWSLDTQVLIAYVRHPAGQMPPYTEKVMSDRQLADVAAYLKSIPAPKPAKDIPLLSDAPAK